MVFIHLFSNHQKHISYKKSLEMVQFLSDVIYAIYMWWVRDDDATRTDRVLLRAAVVKGSGVGQGIEKTLRCQFLFRVTRFVNIGTTFELILVSSFHGSVMAYVIL